MSMVSIIFTLKRKRWMILPKMLVFLACMAISASCTPTSASSSSSNDEYDKFNWRKIRKDYKAIEEKLKPIHDVRSGPQETQFGAGDYERFIQAGNLRRRYEIHVPPSYNKKRPMPVVLNFHGGGGRAGSARLNSRMDEKADQAGFIVIYPDGTGAKGSKLLSWNAGRCCGYAMEHNVDDVGFIRALLDDLQKLFSIDSDRVYATGLSNGGLMCYRLACDLSDRIAAIAPIAGVMVLDDCKPTYPVSIIHFHGTKDEMVPYGGGVGKRSVSKTDFPSVDSTIQQWIKKKKISSKQVKVTKKGGATITTYSSPKGSEIVLVTMEGMGHTWPGGRRMLPKMYEGEMSRDISANDMMWDFFQNHPLNRANKE